ncbi:MAG: hypothetical protein WBH63_02695, partial [Bacillota bacterium]
PIILQIMVWWLKSIHLFQKGGRKTATFSKKVVEILPPEPQKAPKTGLQPENVVDSLPPEAVWVVQTLPFMSVCSKKSKGVVGIVPPLRGKVVENRPFMSVCSKELERIAVIEAPL